jgi:hypothetical protein
MAGMHEGDERYRKVLNLIMGWKSRKELEKPKRDKRLEIESKLLELWSPLHPGVHQYFENNLSRLRSGIPCQT